MRHTTATLLKNLGVPARDAQPILGHSRLAVTQEIYTHEDRQAQHDALSKISAALRNEGQAAPVNPGQRVSIEGVNCHLLILTSGVLPGGAKGLEPLTPCLQTTGTTSTGVHPRRSPSRSVYPRPSRSVPVAVLPCCTQRLSHGPPKNLRDSADVPAAYTRPAKRARGSRACRVAAGPVRTTYLIFLFWLPPGLEVLPVLAAVRP